MRSFGILRGIEWHFLKDVSGQPIGPILEGQAVEKELWLFDPARQHRQRMRTVPTKESNILSTDYRNLMLRRKYRASGG